MNPMAVLLDRTKYLLVVAVGLIFAVSGALSILLSGEDVYSLAVGAFFFLAGMAVIIFAERIEGNM